LKGDDKMANTQASQKTKTPAGMISTPQVKRTPGVITTDDINRAKREAESKKNLGKQETEDED
jgi:hypothetical protein